MAKATILTYVEIAGRLDDIIGSLRDNRTKPEDACSRMADELDRLSIDIEQTHKACPDVPNLATLSVQLTDTADRLRDRRRLAFEVREEEARFIESLRDGLQMLADERPEFDEFIRESRGDAPAAQIADSVDLDPGSLTIGCDLAEPGGDVTVVHELHSDPATPPEEIDPDGQSDPLDG